MKLKLTVGKQITFLAAVLIIGLVIVSSLSLYSLTKLEKEAKYLQVRVTEELLIVGEMRLAVVQVQQWLTDISATRAATGYDDGFKEADRWTKIFYTNSSKIKKLKKNDKNAVNKIKKIEKLFKDYYEMGKKMAEAYIEFGPDRGNLIMDEFDPFAERLIEYLNDQNDDVIIPLKQRFSAISKNIEWIKMLIAGVVIISFIVSLGMAFFLIKMVNSRLFNVSDDLSSSSRLVDATAEKVDQSSNSLTEITNEQASALQETVASIDEISAMVRRNSESAKNSMNLSSRGQKTLHLGQEAVENMIESVHEINKSNEEIASYMEKSNQDISNIVMVIGEIGDKTKVINDIVFQTKLLSFNASVEAARAGEHGKGFAVVAEEVGNLAQMSGDSAKEISTLLDSSIGKVEETVEQTKEQLDILMKRSKVKISDGVNKAQYCGDLIQDILIQSTEVNQMVKEISQASDEQAQGIEQVTIAMGQLDQVTQQNMTLAKQASMISIELSRQSRGLKDIVVDLRSLVVRNDHLDQVLSNQGQKSLVTVDNKITIDHSHSSELEKINKDISNEKQNVTQLKIVGDSSSQIPSEDDPRFEDI